MEKAKVIKCLAYYDILGSTDNRMNNPAAFTKSTYLFDCLERLGYKVEILSASYIAAKTKCKITYDGAFYVKKYYEFLQKCHIGLSTQNPYEPFNNSSFPSKVLVYMANGLRVVSVYSMYKLIVAHLNNVMNIPFSSIAFALGQTYNTDKNTF